MAVSRENAVCRASRSPSPPAPCTKVSYVTLVHSRHLNGRMAKKSWCSPRTACLHQAQITAVWQPEPYSLYSRPFQGSQLSAWLWPHPGPLLPTAVWTQGSGRLGLLCSALTLGWGWGQHILKGYVCRGTCGGVSSLLLGVCQLKQGLKHWVRSD